MSYFKNNKDIERRLKLNNFQTNNCKGRYVIQQYCKTTLAFQRPYMEYVRYIVCRLRVLGGIITNQIVKFFSTGNQLQFLLADILTNSNGFSSLAYYKNQVFQDIYSA